MCQRVNMAVKPKIRCWKHGANEEFFEMCCSVVLHSNMAIGVSILNIHTR